MNSSQEVIVIGAGPAGCTASAVLAQLGHDVLLIEKESVPRYHIGESLMPFCWYTLERLGLAKAMDETGFVKKYSVSFVTPDGRQSRPFYFFQHRDHPSSITWQVERADFDAMLFRRAQECGARTLTRTRVRDVVRNGEGAVTGVVATGPDGAEQVHSCKMLIDATGRDALLSGKLGWRRRDPALNKVAIWTYFEGAKRDPGIDEGTTTVAYVPHGGWFWYIPLRNNRVSVGLVGERHDLYRDGVRDPAAIFQREISGNKWIEDHLAPGRQTGEYWVTGEFSYRSEYCAGDGFVLAGDAFAFLDPVFSSGVFLALKTGELAADAVHSALARGDTSAAQFQAYGETVCAAIERMRALVYAFYNQDFSFGRLIRDFPDVRPVLTDCLIGDLFEDKFGELFDAVGKIAELPRHLDYGKHTAPAAGNSSLVHRQ